MPPRLTEELIKKKSGHFDLGCITRLNLADIDINRIEQLQGCTALLELHLQRNSITSAASLGSAVGSTLRTLYLESNRITSVAGWEPLPKLEELHLEGNDITSLAGLTPKRFPSLRRLFFTSVDKSLSNPVSSTNDSYVEDVRKALPNLLSLDGEVLALRDVHSSSSSSSSLGTESSVSDSQLSLELAAVSKRWNDGVDWTLPTEPIDEEKFNAKIKPFEDALKDCNQQLINTKTSF